MLAKVNLKLSWRNSCLVNKEPVHCCRTLALMDCRLRSKHVHALKRSSQSPDLSLVLNLWQDLKTAFPICFELEFCKETWIKVWGFFVAYNTVEEKTPKRFEVILKLINSTRRSTLAYTVPPFRNIAICNVQKDFWEVQSYYVFLFPLLLFSFAVAYFPLYLGKYTELHQVCLS